MQTQTILHFWFEELTAKQHFVKDSALNGTIRARFGDLLAAAARCELFAWRATAQGRLAEIIVLDQFSRSQEQVGWCGVCCEASIGPCFLWPQDLALH